ncbi:MAG: hypothetical protein EPO07_06540 [Verrucomicrobia bacterium]|nr:MAG: hypothetical protein EPO07_06540 [Verrucomicrobiota bacterium]
MEFKRSSVGFSLAVAGLVFCGCGKTESPAVKKETPATNAVNTTSAPATLPVREVSRLHWLGKRQLGSATNSTLLAVWRLPESARLEAHILDRLALAPWRLLKSDTATNGAPTVLLRPLLQDLLDEEVYAEVFHPTNQPAQFTLAVRVSAERGELWRTNLATVVASLTGVQPAAQGGGWSAASTNRPAHFELARKGDWTVVLISSDLKATMSDALARAESGRAAFSKTGTDNFLAAELDLDRLADVVAFNRALATNLPRVSLALGCPASNVVTTATLEFPQPLGLTLDPWRTPTNLIHGPLHSFTAVRGVQSLLGSSALWKNYGSGDAPNQAFFWAQQPAPFLTFMALPLADPAKVVGTFAEHALENSRPWFATHRSGHLDWHPETSVFQWGGLLLMAPFARPAEVPEGKFLFSSFANSTLNSPPPATVMDEFLSRTNAVYYDRELTGARMDGWIYLSQTIRLTLYFAQLPGDSPSIKWLQAAAPKVGNSTTFVTKSGPSQLTFSRESSLGLTALEMHVLAEWAESPTFPVGLHSLVAPQMPPPRH